MATIQQIIANRRNRKAWRGHTEEGLRKIREAALRNQPWHGSTGPRTKRGKDRSKMNALKHGGRSLGVIDARKQLADLTQGLRARFLVQPPSCKSKEAIRSLVRSVHADFDKTDPA